jgi:hypothetical protein
VRRSNADSPRGVHDPGQQHARPDDLTWCLADEPLAEAGDGG